MSTSKTTAKTTTKTSTARPKSEAKTPKENAAPAKAPDRSTDIINHLVKIKPTSTTFISGKGVAEWVRNTETFVSRVNPNGTIVIGDSISLTDIDALFMSDVEILDEVRENFDEETECPDVSIRIFGVPERMDWIRKNQERLHLSDEFVFIDYNHEGCIATAKKAWEYPTEKKFTLVLQDDVELCDNFMHYVNLIVATQPDALISLFSTQFSNRSAVSRVPKKSPYISTDILTAQGIIMKTEWVEPCLATWKEGVAGDDANIVAWAKENNIQILTTIPATLQHIGDTSVFDRTRSMGRSAFYKKNPTNANWGCDYVTPWKDVVG